MYENHPEKTMNLNAYYYGFDSTGNEAIDRILSAVASAGKKFHHTDNWSEPLAGGKSCADLIQEAANAAALVFNSAAQSYETHRTMLKSVEDGLIVPSDVPCPKCAQVPDGQGGEYPCSVCGIPTLHDAQVPHV